MEIPKKNQKPEEDPSEVQLDMDKHWFISHRFLWWVAGCLFLVVVAGSYYWWQEIKTVDKLQVTADSKKDLTADWKTYTNSQYGFSFKYPGWYFDDVQIPDSCEHYYCAPVPKPEFPVISQYSKEENLEISIERGKYSDGQYSVPSEDMIVQVFGKNAKLKVYNFVYNGVVSKDHVPQIAYFYTGDYSTGNPVTLMFRYDSNYKDKARQYINQILSTFKFTDSTDTSTWKTYTNDYFGIEIKYPADGSIVPNILDDERNTFFALMSSKDKSKAITFSIGNYAAKTLREWQNEPKMSDSNLVYKNTTINGYDALEYDFSANHKTYVIGNEHFKFVEVDIKDLPQGNLILSTFKFTEEGVLPQEISSNPIYKAWANQKKTSYGFDVSNAKSNTETIKPLSNSSYDGTPVICNNEYGDQSKCIKSPDGTKTILISTGGEPDSDLFLYDKTKKLSTRLLDCGTPCYFENGFWLNNSQFVFLESVFDIDYTDASYEIDTFNVLQYDFAKNTVTNYSSNFRIKK